jgi:hypothetical protein
VEEISQEHIVRSTTTIRAAIITNSGIHAEFVPIAWSFGVETSTSRKLVHRCGEPRSVVNEELAREQLSTGHGNSVQMSA